ncbi:MAG: hypothetical protein QY303_10520 [Vicingaceae bacterium]|nr:MAG: hypothetical protein QY303_10520 [Vicingaceae bacterium]
MLFLACDLFAQDDTLKEAPKESNLKLNGYVKKLHGIFLYPDENSLQWALVHNRLNSKWNPSSNFSTVLEIRNRILYGENVKNGMYNSKLLDRDNGAADLTFLPFDTKSAKMVTSVERFWARYTIKNTEITLGRQRINWGVNLVWNPNDIFNTYSFIDFDYEERTGSDAIRLKIGAGEMSALELAAKPGKNKNDDVYAFMYKMNKAGFDFQLLFGLYEKDASVGTGWAGNIGKIGFKGEATYFHEAQNFSDTCGMINATTEFDYTIVGKVYVNASYLFNSEGLTTPDVAASSQLVTNGNVTAKFLSPSMHSAFLQIKSISSPVFSTGISGIYFFEMNGLYLFPSLSYSINDRWEASIFLQSYWLKEKEMENKMNNLLIRIKCSF